MGEAVREPNGLYDLETLLGGWDPDDPLSYASTLDASIFRTAAAAGLRMPADEEIARGRALHDHRITRALSAHIEGKPVVAFTGGHKLDRGSTPYTLVSEIAWRLTNEGYLVVSGGGPGAMEASHLGARLAHSPHADLVRAQELLARHPAFPRYEPRDFLRPDGAFDERLLAALHRWQAPAFEVAALWSGESAGLSIGVPTWLYGHEPPTPLASFHAKYFENSIREDGLLAIAKAGVIFAEGKAGTLQEVFQDAAQNYYSSVDATRSPMVFLDLDEYWTVKYPVRLLLEGLFDEETEQLLRFVETADDAVDAIRAGPSTATGALI